MTAPEPEFRLIAVKEGLYPELTGILLRPHPAIADSLRAAACGALAVAAAEASPERTAAAGELVKAASSCLVRGGAPESLALAALALIRGLASSAAAAGDDGKARSAAVQGGGTAAAVGVLWRRSASVALLRAAVSALSALLSEGGAPAIAAKDGAASALAAAMRRDVATRELRAAAVKALARVLKAAPAGGSAATGLSGVYEALELVLRERPEVNGTPDEIAAIAKEWHAKIPAPKTPRNTVDPDE
jgi:hypothetical protein